MKQKITNKRTNTLSNYAPKIATKIQQYVTLDNKIQVYKDSYTWFAKERKSTAVCLWLKDSQLPHPRYLSMTKTEPNDQPTIIHTVEPTLAQDQLCLVIVSISPSLLVPPLHIIVTNSDVAFSRVERWAGLQCL